MTLTEKGAGVVITGIFLAVLIAGIFVYYYFSYLIKLHSSLATDITLIFFIGIEAAILWTVYKKIKSN